MKEDNMIYIIVQEGTTVCVHEYLESQADIAASCIKGILQDQEDGIDKKLIAVIEGKGLDYKVVREIKSVTLYKGKTLKGGGLPC